MSTVYNKEYYQQHRAELLKRGSEKVQCPQCKQLITRSNLRKHNKTRKCQRAAGADTSKGHSVTFTFKSDDSEAFNSLVSVLKKLEQQENY